MEDSEEELVRLRAENDTLRQMLAKLTVSRAQLVDETRALSHEVGILRGGLIDAGEGLLAACEVINKLKARIEAMDAARVGKVKAACSPT